MNASLGAIGETRSRPSGGRLAWWAADTVILLAAGVVATWAITSGGRGEWGSILAVGLTIGLLSGVLRPVVEWMVPPLRTLVSPIFLILMNTALFGIADRLSKEQPNLRFRTDTFWDAAAGAVMLVAVSIVLQRVVGLITRRRRPG